MRCPSNRSLLPRGTASQVAPLICALGTLRQMVYTCYEMIRDCRADLPAGWSYFLSQYVPTIRRLIQHYAPEKAGDAALVERILLAIRKPESSMFQSLEPAPD